MTKDALYTLDELGRAANIAPRTIRFYTSEGLLPGPQARGRFALYGPGHLARLRLIALLKTALMPLGQMREHIGSLTDAHVAGLLNGAGMAQNAMERLSSQAAYALEPGAVGTPIAEQSAAYHALANALNARLAYDAAPPTQPQAPEMQNDRIRTDKAQVDAPSSDSRKTRRALLVSSRLLASDRPQQNDNAADASTLETTSGTEIENRKSKIENPDTWQRILLAPGVELHVRTPDSPRGREQLDRAIAHAKSLFQP